VGIANIINNSTTTSGGEIVRELVNSSDGAGLNLQSGGNIEIANGAAQFGTSDFSLEFILNQEKENTSESYIYVTHTSGDNRLLIFHDVSDDNLVLDFRNASSASTKKDLAYDMNQDFGSPTHYVITFDRDGLATLYKNGNSVATVDISSTSAIDIGTDSSGSRIGTPGTDGVIGTFYRFRTWNYLVDAKALYERADVDYSSQYGTTNAPFTSINLSSGWSAINANATVDDSDSYTTTSGGTGVMYPLTVGKKYRLTWNVTGSAFDGPKLYTVGEVYIAIPDAPSSGTLTGTLEFTATKEKLYLRNSSAGTVDINSMSLVQIGCVSDYDLAYAQPTQSRMVQDRAGAADGTASTSGVTQVQPVVQGNLTSLAVGTGPVTPSDNQIHLKAADGAYGIIHENASGVKVATYTGGSSAFIGTQGAHSMAIATGGSEKLTIDSSGKTTSKAADNVFTVQDTEDTVADANAEVRIGESDASGNLNNYWGLKFAGTASGGDLDVNRNGTTALTIDSSGHVIVANMPTSSSGLASGTLYSDGGTIKIV
jgi:hypothetical protein